MGAEESKKVVMRLFEMMDKRDIEGVLSLLTEDATWWVIGNLPNISGTRNKQEFAELLKFMFPRIGNAPFIVDHMIAEGNYVAAETHVEGKTPKGDAYENKYHFKFEVKDGKLRRVRAYNDTALIKEVILGK